jgi:hypothetical protein
VGVSITLSCTLGTSSLWSSSHGLELPISWSNPVCLIKSYNLDQPTDFLFGSAHGLPSGPDCLICLLFTPPWPL